MPQTEIPSRAELADDSAGTPEEAGLPRVAVRGADGGILRFDEIVTPHPVVAFLFRRRTLIVQVGVLVMLFLARPQPAMLAAGIGLALVSECWRIWAAGTIHKTEELTTGGPYAYVRHPLYVGSFGHAVAYCFMSGWWQSFLVCIPLFLLLYSAAVTTEEAMLHKLFGERYVEYSARVPRFVPRLTGRHQGHGRFSWRQAMANKEYINVLWVVLLSGLFVARLLGGP